MEIPGVCSICGAHGRVYTCVLCGRLVCATDRDAAGGACVVCAGRRVPTDLPDLPDDVGPRTT